MGESSSPSSGSSSSSQFVTDKFMDEVKAQLEVAHFEEFVETAKGNCFDKCITKPGSLGGNESKCISKCVDRYIEAIGIISRSLFTSPR